MFIFMKIVFLDVDVYLRELIPVIGLRFCSFIFSSCALRHSWVKVRGELGPTKKEKINA